MPYMMGGFPDTETSLAVADAYADGGADLVELGVPYSDPLADGPVIHAAGDGGARRRRDARLGARRSARGSPTRVPVVRDGLREHGPRPRARALRRGARRRRAPPARSSPTCRRRRAARSPPRCAAPGSRWSRWSRRRPRPSAARASAAGAEGFVYVVSDTRTTGERDELPARARRAGRAPGARTRRCPVAVGFGIGTPEQAAEVGAIADGVIIGTRLVRAVGEAAGRPRPSAREFLAGGAIRAGGRSSISGRATARLHRRRPDRDDLAYAFSLGGTVAALIFLFVLFNGVLDRWAQPMLEWIRA